MIHRVAYLRVNERDLFGGLYVSPEEHDAPGLHFTKHGARSLGQFRARQSNEQQAPCLAFDPLRVRARFRFFTLRHKFGFVASLMFQSKL